MRVFGGQNYFFPRGLQIRDTSFTLTCAVAAFSILFDFLLHFEFVYVCPFIHIQELFLKKSLNFPTLSVSQTESSAYIFISFPLCSQSWVDTNTHKQTYTVKYTQTYLSSVTFGDIR